MNSELDKFALVVDDEARISSLIAEILRKDDWNVTTCSSADEAFELIGLYPWSLVLCDVVLGGTDGYEVLKRFSRECPAARFVLMTGHGSGAGALDATAIGAHDYLSKPFKIEQILGISRAILDRTETTVPPDKAQDESLTAYQSDLGLIGSSPAFIECLKLVGRVASTELPVLVSGESGTGKEVIARAIHKRSRRADGPFVPVNCGAIPVELIESELFGHTKGSFTGADRERQGLFEEADGGTIFLDEITETGPLFQVKLLRALQEREVRRVGANKSVPVDVRVIAATNRSIENEVKEGRFRQDLMYRLNVVSIELPPLRDRADDILLLAKHSISRSERPDTRISSSAKTILTNHIWEGNIRELENVILGAVALADGVIYPEHLPQKLVASNVQRKDALPIHEALVSSAIGQSDLVTLSEMEERYVSAVLEQTGGNKQAAARILDIDRKTLIRIAERARK